MQRLTLIAKRPRLGQVKTRLAASIGEAAALSLYRAFLDDSTRLLGGVAGVELELCYDGPAETGDPQPPGFTITTQGEGSLGSRLARVSRRAFDAGVDGLVLIGADAPTLAPRRLTECLAALEAGVDAVAAPAADGGYLLLGLGAPHLSLFDGMPWSTERLLEATRRAAAAGGLKLVELAGGYDVDDLESLERLREELAEEPAAAPATRAALARIDASRDRVV